MTNIDKEDYYVLSQIREKVDSTVSASMPSFYRHVMAGNIKKHPDDVSKRKGIRYQKESVDAFLAGSLSDGRRSSGKRSTNLARSSTLVHALKPIIEPVRGHDDVGEVYKIESWLLGWGNAIYPHIIENWQGKNEYVYWLLRNPENHLDVWAVLGVLPLSKNTILRLIRGEMKPMDISSDDVLNYEAGQEYSCYITSAATVPEHRDSIVPLVQYLLSYWCESAQVRINELFAVSDMTIEDIPMLRLVTEHNFRMIYEFSQANSVAWVLPFNLYNPSRVIQNFRECQKYGKENTSMAVAIPVADELLVKKQTKEKKAKNLSQERPSGADGRFTASYRFRLAQSDNDIREIVRINRALFGAGSTLSEENVVNLLRSWWDQNKEVFQVLEVDGTVVGYVSLLPLPMSVIKGIMSDDVRVSQIRPSDIQVFEPDRPVDLYVWTVGLHPKAYKSLQEKRTMGRYLLQGIIEMFRDFGRRGIEVRSAWARSDTDDGMGISQGLGFESVNPTPSKSGKPVFMLDLVWSDRPYLIKYMQALTEYRTEHSVKNEA